MPVHRRGDEIYHRYLALATQNARREQKFPITQRGRDLIAIFAMDRRAKENCSATLVSRLIKDLNLSS